MSRALLLALLFAVPLRGAEVHVSAAASLSNVMTELARGWEKATGHRVVLNFGGSSILARQIRQGAPADLFIAADEGTMNDLERDGLIDGRTRISFLTNTLVVVVPKDGGRAVRHGRDLVTMTSVAIAEPSSVPAGIYARQWLVKVGLWERIAPNVIPTDNVRSALAAVESGNADAAIVYRTDARIAKNVRIALHVPASEAPSISYPFAVTRDAGQPAAARAFLAWLQSKAARDIFARHGFLLR